VSEREREIESRRESERRIEKETSTNHQPLEKKSNVHLSTS